MRGKVSPAPSMSSDGTRGQNTRIKNRREPDGNTPHHRLSIQEEKRKKGPPHGMGVHPDTLCLRARRFRSLECLAGWIGRHFGPPNQGVGPGALSLPGAPRQGHHREGAPEIFAQASRPLRKYLEAVMLHGDELHGAGGGARRGRRGGGGRHGGVGSSPSQMQANVFARFRSQLAKFFTKDLGQGIPMCCRSIYLCCPSRTNGSS